MAKMLGWWCLGVFIGWCLRGYLVVAERRRMAEQIKRCLADGGHREGCGCPERWWEEY